MKKILCTYRSAQQLMVGCVFQCALFPKYLASDLKPILTSNSRNIF